MNSAPPSSAVNHVVLDAALARDAASPRERGGSPGYVAASPRRSDLSFVLSGSRGPEPLGVAPRVAPGIAAEAARVAALEREAAAQLV